MLAHSAAASVVPTAQGDWLFSPMWTQMTPPDVYWEPRYSYGYETMNQTMKNLGTGGSTLTAGTTFNPIITHDFGTGTDYYVSSSSDWDVNRNSGIFPNIGASANGGTIVFLHKGVDNTGTSGDNRIIEIGGIGVDVSGGEWKPYVYGESTLLAWTAASYTSVNTDNQWRMITVTFTPGTITGGLQDITWTTYKNATQSWTDSWPSTSGWSSNANSSGAAVHGLNDYNFGSIMRFRYPLNGTQITAIKDYLETKYGTFGA